MSDLKVRHKSIMAVIGMLALVAASGTAVGAQEGVDANSGTGPDASPPELAEPLLATPAAPVDFDGDGKTDAAVVRNTGGGPAGQVTWFIKKSSDGSTLGIAWGLATDFFVPADYDGDGKADLAVWRPGPAGAATWFILYSATNYTTFDAVPFGQTGDDPTVVDDYDGDGQADLAVYRAGANAGDQSIWYYRPSTDPGILRSRMWGVNGDFPAPGDYDGDGQADFVTQRDNGAGQARIWFLNTTDGFSTTLYGTPTDLIAPGDYDGDGKTDLAVVRSSGGQGTWIVRSSDTLGITYLPWGVSSTDSPAPGDYDGDGMMAPAIWRKTNGTFWLTDPPNSTVVGWGADGDFAVANSNVH